MGGSLSTVERNMARMDEPANYKIATFALGCFWHPDALFGCQKGVYRTRVGYTSGKKLNPTYRDLGDHTEAIEIDYDKNVIGFEGLLKLFWKNVDSTESYKRQYRSAIFYRDEEEQNLATESKNRIEKALGKNITTAIEPFQKFYPAEEGDHIEAIEIDYDKNVIGFEGLLKLFWKNVDSTESYKRQYRSAIFYRDEEEFDYCGAGGIPCTTDKRYHQKYYLQTHHKKLFNSLGIKQRDLMNSQVAAKLNGYVVGENTLEAFNAEFENFCLSPENVDYVRKMIARGKQAHC